MAKMINECPLCGEKMKVTRLSCPSCHIEITGEFANPLSNLSNNELEFMINFVKVSGNIKEMEKLYKQSYPTIKKNLDSLIAKLNGTTNKTDVLDLIRTGHDEGLTGEIISVDSKDAKVKIYLD